MYRREDNESVIPAPSMRFELARALTSMFFHKPCRKLNLETGKDCSSYELLVIFFLQASAKNLVEGASRKNNSHECICICTNIQNSNG